MKQINICLDRFFEGKKPLKTKWQAIRKEKDDRNFLFLYHYQHLILVYDLDNKQESYSYYECPTDKRGLDAALLYLNEVDKNA